MEQVTDRLETLIIMAMDARHGDFGAQAIRRGRSTEGTYKLVDAGEILKLDSMQPRSAYTFAITEENRIFATQKEYLMAHPAEVIGDEAEAIVLDGGQIRWCGLRRIRQAPRGCACLGVASHWYEMHKRFVNYDGSGGYEKRLIPLSRNGTPLPATAHGISICNPKFDGSALIMTASIIEDAYRANTMLATVKDDTEIKFPVPLDDYKNVFADRDGPMTGARRKAIIHWVATHLRHSTRGLEYEVKRHTRGVQEFTIDGLRIRLTPNAVDHAARSGRVD